MYTYTIYEKRKNEEVKLEFICNENPNSTVRELEKIASKRLAELQEDHPNPSAIKMKRKLTPLL